MSISQKIANAWKSAMDNGRDKIILLCDSRLRWPLAAMLARSVSQLPVVAYDEVVLGTPVESLETILAEQTQFGETAGLELAGAAK